jgi:hypothetical protein
MLLTFETRSAKQTGQHTTERKTTTTATTKVEKDASKHLLIPSRFLLLGSSAHERFSNLQTEKSDLLGNQKRRFDVAVSSSRTPPSLTKSEQR